MFDIDLIDTVQRPIINSQSLLAFVLPSSNHYLLNKKVKTLVDNNYHEYYAENNINMVYAFCRYIWEAHITFKHDIDIIKLDNEINLLTRQYSK